MKSFLSSYGLDLGLYKLYDLAINGLFDAPFIDMKNFLTRIVQKLVLITSGLYSLLSLHFVDHQDWVNVP